MERRELLSAVVGLGALTTVGADPGEAEDDSDIGRSGAEAADGTVTLDVVLTDE
jgi:hypothetical protein